MAVIRIPLSEVHGLRVAFWIDGEPVSWNETTGKVDKYKVLRFRDRSGIGGNYDPALSAFPSLWTAAHRLQNQATFLSVWGDPSDEDFAKVFPKSPNTQVQV